MMNCSQCKENQIAYLLQELSDKEQNSLELHLQKCASCKKRSQALLMIWQGLDSQTEQLPNSQLSERFHLMLADEIEKSKSVDVNELALKNLFLSFWPSRPAWAVSYSLALLFSGMLMGQILPQGILSFQEGDRAIFSQAENSENQFDFSNIPEDRLIQICAVQNNQLLEIL